MNFAAILNMPLTELLGRRKPPPPRRALAPKPRMGATLCCAGLRMTVQAGLTDEMWSWLAALGWRELRGGAPDDRQKILLLAIREATRPREAARADRSPSN